MSVRHQINSMLFSLYWCYEMVSMTYMRWLAWPLTKDCGQMSCHAASATWPAFGTQQGMSILNGSFLKTEIRTLFWVFSDLLSKFMRSFLGKHVILDFNCFMKDVDVVEFGLHTWLLLMMSKQKVSATWANVPADVQMCKRYSNSCFLTPFTVLLQIRLWQYK